MRALITHSCIIVQDSGIPSLSAERHLAVHVGDVNDNVPVLSSHHYTVSVPENTPAGSFVSPLLSLHSVCDGEHFGWEPLCPC